ncbi:MAG TPA: FAD-dependent oxidoreductase [Candidatus Paceibacterota bacterium]|jgi:thioredoxin reductase (NADPH)|nr:FAD-dependent oxidoreductase [Candidatus Paceibacterota bacterium]HRZ29692.1 FAD-dependent oxidoreductase [Candidatus Paceibacterota bacterium]
MENEIYDLIILGSGPAGVSAAIYAERYNLKSIMIGELFGGTVMYPHKITNFPSYAEISGIDLINNFRKHIESMNYKVIEDQIIKVENLDNNFNVYLRKGQKIVGKNILVALGTFRRKLNAKGEDAFIGKGVHYCAICDAVFYKDKTAIVVGSGDGAAMAVLLLSPIAKQVYQIIRKDELKVAPDTLEKLEKLNNYTLIKNNEIIEIAGDKFVNKVFLKEDFGNKKEIEIDGVFIEIGGAPNSAIINDLNIKIDNNGYINVDNCMKTNVPGV